MKQNRNIKYIKKFNLPIISIFIYIKRNSEEVMILHHPVCTVDQNMDLLRVYIMILPWHHSRHKRFEIKRDSTALFAMFSCHWMLLNRTQRAFKYFTKWPLKVTPLLVLWHKDILLCSFWFSETKHHIMTLKSEEKQNPTKRIVATQIPKAFSKQFSPFLIDGTLKSEENMKNLSPEHWTA